MSPKAIKIKREVADIGSVRTLFVRAIDAICKEDGVAIKSDDRKEMTDFLAKAHKDALVGIIESIVVVEIQQIIADHEDGEDGDDGDDGEDGEDGEDDAEVEEVEPE